MSSSRIPSPARSQGVISTPRKHTPRRSRSVCSARSNMSVRLTAVISDSFKLSPMPNRRSVLNDDTDIEIPGRKSWWKKLGENSRDVMEVLESEDIAEVNNVAEEFDVEILSQEKKNYSIDLPESSDGESINSIVIPQRKLFTQKDNQPQTKFGHIIDNRETLAKLQKSHFDQEKEINIAPKNLFNQASKPRTKPAFPAALLNISSKTVNKTKEMPTAEVKGQVRNLFGNRPGMKRKNMFADFIVSDSEDEIPDIQPKVFGFQKNTGQKRRESSPSRGVGHSPTSSIDLELEDWKLLPSSTMVDNQLEEAGATTPVKRARLSKLSEAKESETTNINSTVNKTKQSNKSVNSKNKSKNSSNSKLKENNLQDSNPASKTKEDIVISQNNQSLNSSTYIRLTRNKSKSMRESSFKEEDHSKLHNKSKNTLQSKQSTPVKALFHERVKNTDQDVENNIETNLIQNEVEIQNISTGQVPGDDEDFTLEYENDDEPMNEINEPTTSNNADNTKNKESNNQSSKIHEDASIKTLIEVHQVQNESNEDNDFVDAIIETVKGHKEAVDETNTEISKKQKDRDEVGINTNIEKGEQHNKSNQNLVKNSDKKENKSELEEEVPKQSQCAVKYQEQNLTNIQNNSRESENVNMDDEIQQKTQNNSQIEEEINDKVDSENFVENENVNQQIESKDHEQSDKNVMQNESEHTDDENVIQNESEHTDDENVMQNESEHTDDENVMQNESEHTVNENVMQNKSEHADDENVMQNESEQTSTREEEDKQNDSVDEASIDAEENEDSDQIYIDKQNKSDETEHEAEDQTDQDESENINTDDQEQNDSNSNQNEIEEQQNEEIEIDEEENESEVDEQNETEDQDESENADSDDNLQNESNQEENVEENEQIESDQEQSDNEIEDNQVPEDEVVANETSNDHDTTGRHRKKEVTNIKSPEAILHDKTNQIESFTAQGRNTSVRKTKSIIKNINIRPSLAPVRESTGMSDGTRDSSAEGSGWDSHRTTRKTIRLTLGKDFTPRKSLRALVMEKSAKRNTNYNEIMANTTKIPQANSTELPAFDSYQEAEPVHVDETVEEPSDHEVSARTRQTTLEMYLQKIKQENLERKRKMEEEIRASLKAPTRDTFNSFKVPLKPIKRVKPIQNKPKTKQIKSSLIPLDMLPSEVLEDMKYKPPKRFQPSNASWITKRLYKFLESKLEPKYDYKARVRAERLVELLYSFTREARRGASEQAVDTLKKEMARLDVVKTHFDFYEFFHEFMPREIRVKVVPDVVNKISLPKNGVFSDIII